MSLTAARSHPWLRQSFPGATGANDTRELHDPTFSSPGVSFADSSLTSLPDDDDSAMADLPQSEPSVSDGLEQLQLDHQTEFPQQNGGRLPLQRLSQVLADAAENNVELPEPSWQMLDAAGAAPARAVKRKLNEHDSQSRSAEMEVGDNLPGLSHNRNGGARKKGKQEQLTGSSDGEGSAASGDGARATAAAPSSKRGAVAGKGRGRGRGAGAVQVKARLQETAAGMVVEEDHMDDDTEPRRPRRSSRTTPNKGRRVA